MLHGTDLLPDAAAGEVRPRSRPRGTQDHEEEGEGERRADSGHLFGFRFSDFGIRERQRLISSWLFEISIDDELKTVLNLLTQTQRIQLIIKNICNLLSSFGALSFEIHVHTKKFPILHTFDSTQI